MKINFRKGLVAAVSALFLISGYASACGLRDNGATMTDSDSGMEIQKCFLGQNWISGLCTGSKQELTWSDAYARFGKANNLGWRLPSLSEVQPILPRSKGCPLSESTWTSSAGQAYGDNHMYVLFANADIGGTLNKTHPIPVRLIRTGQWSGVTNTSQSGTSNLISSSQQQAQQQRQDQQRAQDQQRQQAQAAVQQAQSSARNAQARTDASAQRAGRKTHDLAAEANECVIRSPVGDGQLFNNCDFGISVSICAIEPKAYTGAMNITDSFSCEDLNRGFGGLWTPPAKSVLIGMNERSAKGGLAFFACKGSAYPADTAFDGTAITARCR